MQKRGIIIIYIFYNLLYNYLARSKLIDFACIGVATLKPWLEQSRGSNPNAGKMDQT